MRRYFGCRSPMVRWMMSSGVLPVSIKPLTEGKSATICSTTTARPSLASGSSWIIKPPAAHAVRPGQHPKATAAEFH